MKNRLLNDGTFILGIILIILSLVIFLIPEIFSAHHDINNSFAIFVVNYIISIGYFVVICIHIIPKRRWKAFHQNIEYGFLHLLLCLISAYSLNREFNVFENSTGWLQVALLLQGVVLIVLFFKKDLPTGIQQVLFVLLGVIVMLFLYLSIYLIPLYTFSLVAFFALGISLHALIPLLFVISIIAYVLRGDNRNRQSLISFGSGIFISLAVITVFAIRWNDTSRLITNASDASLLNEKNVLPEWVVIAQNLPKNSITEKILKTDLVYSTAPENTNWSFINTPSKGFDEVKKHDPLIMITTYFFGRPSLSNDNKINILQAMYDSRHQAQERLWTGDDLKTGHILTNIRLFPGLRLGYTEKFITVRNNLPKHTWRREQEAIYTFHLPEGAVVTSLSLWINGQEQKAVLTSRHKADSAYKTVVGVEHHDPSMIHWQEGNTVSCRVFPCTPDEERRFKIGITAPLRRENDKLICDNIYFDGPSATAATEKIQLKIMDSPLDLQIPSGFKKTQSGEYVSERRYSPDWQIKLALPSISQNSFYFDGKSYQVSDLQKSYQPIHILNVYLDVNHAWTRNEFDQIRSLTKGLNVFVYQQKLIKLNDQNAEDLFPVLQQLNFSIFPLYFIKSPENSLFISKGTASSPNLSDLKGSEFQTRLEPYLLNHPDLKLFNLGYELTPYLKTLKELRLFTYESGGMSELTKVLTSKKFVINQENEHQVVIDDAEIKITESQDSTFTNAPDDLMRLFAYNNVMQQTGVHYLQKEYQNDDITEKAHRAYVVSPTTSLVVLETKQDYARFGISDEGVSLKNASMKSSGAVPEPHEWLLIVILFGVLVFVFIKR